VSYLYANFGLPRPLCSRLRPDVRDRQTDVRQTDVRRASSLNAPYPRGGGIISDVYKIGNVSYTVRFYSPCAHVADTHTAKIE